MHKSAFQIFKTFAELYIQEKPVKVLEIGSVDVNGSLKAALSNHVTYTGVDFAKGKNVDCVLEDPYALPFPDKSYDIIVASSVFEHSDFFWLLFNEMARVVSDGGYIYLNTPSNGFIHRYPVDSWRFYPDAGLSLAKWAVKSGFDIRLMESFVANKFENVLNIPFAKENEDYFWNDFVAIFSKGSAVDPKSNLYEMTGGVSNVVVQKDGEINYPYGSYYPQDYVVLKDSVANLEALNDDLRIVTKELADVSDKLMRLNCTFYVKVLKKLRLLKNVY